MAMMSDLPEVMITEILIRLPVISLLIGKCVCKAWLSIISNPNFINSQLHRSCTKNSTVLLTLIRSGQEPQQEPQDQEDLDDHHYNSTSPVRFKSIVTPRLFDGTRGYRYYKDLFISSFNGIICIRSIDDVVHLWNPCISKCKRLPAPPKMLFPAKLGFGYDSISDDYKVVRITAVSSYDRVSFVQVYSNNADSWKEFPAPIILKRVDVRDYRKMGVVNGIVYFATRNGFISFDFHNEVVGIGPLPRIPEKIWRSEMMDFQGSLAMLIISGPGMYELWTLEGHPPAHMCWVRKIRIPNDIWLISYLGARQFWGISNTNHFLYDCESKEIKDYGLLGSKECAFLNYSETLVSLDQWVSTSGVG